jgi:hypothetical protein
MFPLSCWIVVDTSFLRHNHFICFAIFLTIAFFPPLQLELNHYAIRTEHLSYITFLGYKGKHGRFFALSSLILH